MADLDDLYQMNTGNFVMGLGIGVTVTSIVVLASSALRPKAQA
jgi:hypothetical protein